MKITAYNSTSPYTGVCLVMVTMTKVKNKENKKEKEKETIEVHTVAVKLDENQQPVFRPLPKQQLVLLGGQVKY
jgi:hypothetical protein